MADWPYSTARWQRLRADKLARDPLCEDCRSIGRVVAATVVDHKHAISDGGDPFPALDGLSSKCAPCHNAKTARGPEAGAIKTDKPRKGCDDSGLPLDPGHPWAVHGDRGEAERRQGVGTSTGPEHAKSISFTARGGRNG